MRINIEDYNGMCIYAEGVQGFANGFWLDVEELKEFCEHEGVAMPKLVQGCKRETLELDANLVIEDLEEQYADIIEDGELDGRIHRAVREWVRLLNISLDVDHGCHWFHRDDNVEVVLEEPSAPQVGEQPAKCYINNAMVWHCSYCGSQRELIPDNGEEEDCDKFCHNCGTKIDWSELNE